MARFNAGLYIDIRNNEGKLLRHSIIRSDSTKKNFVKNSKSVLYLLVGRKYENQIKSIEETIINNRQSEKYTIETEGYLIDYWYMLIK